MKTKLIAALLVAVSAAVAAPAFASGYGPQRGQSAQTVAAEHNSANSVSADTSYGGVADASSQSGSRQVLATTTRSLYEGH
jgi:hypothetical protein